MQLDQFLNRSDILRLSRESRVNSSPRFSLQISYPFETDLRSVKRNVPPQLQRVDVEKSLICFNQGLCSSCKTIHRDATEQPFYRCAEISSRSMKPFTNRFRNHRYHIRGSIFDQENRHQFVWWNCLTILQILVSSNNKFSSEGKAIFLNIADMFLKKIHVKVNNLVRQFTRPYLSMEIYINAFNVTDFYDGSS